MDKTIKSNDWVKHSESLNKEFGNRSIAHCQMLNGGNFAVTPGSLNACGSATHAKGSPSICKYNEPNVRAEEFLTGLGKIIRDNQTDQGPCVGCRYLIQTKIPKKFVAQYFSGISLHDFSGCNAKCVYCAGSEYFLDKDFTASVDHEVLFKNLFDQRLIRPKGSTISWGGGEPSLVNTFERTVEFLRSKDINQIINTSAIKFSPSIQKVLEERRATVRISTDSGTNETYEKVKRNRNAEYVWKSIKRYASSGGDLVIKYIVFSMNSDVSEVERFIERCAESGVKKICISVDAHAVYSVESNQPKIGMKEWVAAGIMHNLAISKNIAPHFESIWPEDHLEKIKAICNYKPPKRVINVHTVFRKGKSLVKGFVRQF